MKQKRKSNNKMYTNRVHVDSIRVRPSVLERFLQATGKVLGKMVKIDEVLQNDVI